MENFTDTITEAESLVRLAYAFKEENKHPQAYLFIDQAISCYSKALYHAVQEDDEFYKALEDCALMYCSLREEFRKQAFPSAKKLDRTPPEEQSPSMDQQVLNKFDSRVTISTSGSGFSDIVGLAFLKEIFFGCIILLPASRFAEQFSKKGGGKFDQNILLYGSPGNGKTEIVRSYHHEAKGTCLYTIAPADVLSKFIGESEKNLDELFRSAEKQSPSIIFFDEIDGLFSGMRREGHNVSLLNQFLQLMEKAPGVQVIGASNYPWEIPDAMLRRFEHIVHVPLPNKEERVRLLKKYTGPEGIHFDVHHFRNIAEITKGYSCSDLKRVAHAALRIPQAAVIKASYFKRLECARKWYPCAQGDKNAIKMSFLELNADEIEFPKITIADLRKAVHCNSMTTQPGGEYMKKTLEFLSKNGCDGRDGETRKNLQNSIIIVEDSLPANIAPCGPPKAKVMDALSSTIDTSKLTRDATEEPPPAKSLLEGVSDVQPKRPTNGMKILRSILWKQKGSILK